MKLLCRLSAILSCIIFLCTAANSAVIRVKSDSPNPNSLGDTWDTAFHSIKDAIAIAVAGDEIWVAASKYSDSITVKSGVGVYGGFAGTETERAQRNWRANVTVIDGVLATVGFAQSAGQDTVFDGFTVRRYGMAVNYASPIISNNIITGGSGIALYSSNAIISGNMITGNDNGSYYGIIYADSLSSPNIVNNTIVGNCAPFGGSIYLESKSAVIVNNIIAFNSGGVNYRPGYIFKNNNVYGNKSFNYPHDYVVGTDNNISVDPKLAGYLYSNVRIQSDSPCRNAGDNDYAPIFDIDCQPRIQGGTVDIGAYESFGETFDGGPSSIVRVSPNGDDANSGATWDVPKRTVQAAINTALEKGGQVWVKAGTYYEKIELESFVYVYGGFAGNETSLGSRNPKANVTTLDSQQSGSVVTVWHSGYLCTAIDGFTITNGRRGSGGGIFCYGTSPLISNNVITKNTSTDSEFLGMEAGGGGVYCFGGMASICNNTISNNSAFRGAGIYCFTSDLVIKGNTISANNANNAGIGNGGGIYAKSSRLAVTENTLAQNTALDTGGGIWSNNSTKITGNVFTGNTAARGGAIVCDLSGLMNGFLYKQDISQNTINGNSADYGGGIYINEAYPTIADNIISGNSSRYSNSGKGGAIYILNGAYDSRYNGQYWATITGNTIESNSTGDSGGGIWLDGSITSYNSIMPVISKNVIKNNSTISSGGGLCLLGAAEVSNNKIEWNTSVGKGGGIYSVSGQSILNNSIIGNSAGTYGGGIGADTYTFISAVNNTIVGNSATNGGAAAFAASSSCYGKFTNNIIAYNSSGVYSSATSTSYLPTFNYNCMYGNAAQDYPTYSSINGNIFTDPRLTYLFSGDIHISPDSPCHDTGDDASAQQTWLDIDGQARFQGAHVDMGADESDGAMPPALAAKTIVRVATTGSDTNDGSSWAKAKKTIGSGISALGKQGGEIWVKSGTYNECLALCNFTCILGGFSGTESDKGSRQLFANSTIIDGQKLGSVITANGCIAAAIDNFTIRNGSAAAGGGVNASKSALLVSNCRVQGNSSTGPGGAVNSSSSAFQINKSTISGNTTSTYGGAISADHSSLNVVGCVISGNKAISGGGIYHNTGGTLISEISKSRIFDNEAARYAGGIYTFNALISISNNLITGNKGTSNGFAVLGDNKTAFINNTIAGNALSGSSGTGSVVYFTAISSTQPVANNIIAFNSAGIGYYDGGHYLFRNNNVYGNTNGNYISTANLTGTNGNISADPLFGDKDRRIYQLLPGSPCIDTGYADLAPSTDIFGGVRPKDGNGDGIAAVDIGCYEGLSSFTNISSAKSLPDGASVGISCAVSTASFPDRFYAGSPDRIGGIGVLGCVSATGKLVNIEGKMATQGGERVIIPDNVIEARDAVVPAPFHLNHNALGGGALGLQGAVQDYRMVKSPAAEKPARQLFTYGGANNIGTLVKVTGRVGNRGAGFFYIGGAATFDDGSVSTRGIKVLWPFTSSIPPVGRFVEFPAISSCTIKNGILVRLLRPVSADSIMLL